MKELNSIFDNGRHFFLNVLCQRKSKVELNECANSDYLNKKEHTNAIKVTFKNLNLHLVISL